MVETRIIKEMKKYCVTLEFPAPYNTFVGEVDWIDVEAENEEEAVEKARLAVMHRISVNRVEETKQL